MPSQCCTFNRNNLLKKSCQNFSTQYQQFKKFPAYQLHNIYNIYSFYLLLYTVSQLTMRKHFILTAPLLYYCDKLIIFLHDLKGTDESHLRHRLRNRDNLQFIEINPDEVRSILARNRDNLQFIEINPDEVRSIGEKQGQPSVY